MELHFSRAANPTALAAKLNGSLLFRRNRGVATVQDSDVWCSFEGAITKQKLMQACAMTFRHWAVDASLAYEEHRVVDKRLAVPQSAASSSDAVPVNQIAVRSSVEDVKAMAQGLTHSECHSLAVYFTLRAAGPAQGNTDMEAILAWKLRASQAFLEPAANWASEMEKYIPAIPPKVKPCQCRCGCKNLATSLEWCMGRLMPECKIGNQRRAVCAECLHRRGSCHVCVYAPKNEGSLVPPEPTKPVHPVNWYFNAPDDKPWVVKTRNTALDPPLVLITEVIKTHDISSTKSRSVRPHGWQQCLVAKCLLADPSGGVFEASLRWPALVENANWAQNDVVRYVQDWLPGNLQFVGRVMNQQPPVLPNPPSPRTPDWFYTSSVQIEEAGSEEEEPKRDEPEEVKVHRHQRKAVRNSLRGEYPEDQPMSKEERQEMMAALKASKLTRKRKYLASIMGCPEDKVGDISDTDF